MTTTAEYFYGNPWVSQNQFITLTKSQSSQWYGPLPNLPVRRSLPSAVVTKDKVFLIGGFSESWSRTQEVVSAAINSDGGLGTWSVLPQQLPYACAGAQVFATGKRIYVENGILAPISEQDGIRYSAAVNTDGSLGTWEVGTAPVFVIGAAVLGKTGYVYIAGGAHDEESPSTGSTTITRYQIDQATGLITATTSAGALPIAVSLHTMAFVGNRMLLVGGKVAGVASKQVWISGDGDYSSWTRLADIPNGANSYGLYNHGMVVDSSSVFLFGGRRESGIMSSSLVASISGGTVGTFVDASMDMPFATMNHTAFVTSAGIYAVGGESYYNSGGPSEISAVWDVTGGINSYSEVDIPEGPELNPVFVADVTSPVTWQKFGSTAFEVTFTSVDYPSLTTDWHATSMIDGSTPVQSVNNGTTFVTTIQNAVVDALAIGNHTIVTTFANTVLGISVTATITASVTLPDSAAANAPKTKIKVSLFKMDGTPTGSSGTTLENQNGSAVVVYSWKGVKVTATQQTAYNIGTDIIGVESISTETNAAGYAELSVIKGTTVTVACPSFGKSVTVDTTGLDTIDLSTFF